MSQSPLTPMSPMSPQPSGGRGKPTTRFTPLDPVRVLRQYLWLLIVAGVLGIGLGLVSAYMAEKFTPTFTSESMLQVSGEVTNIYEPGTNLVNRDQAEGLKMFMRTQTIRMTSPTVIDDVLKHREVRDTEWAKQFGEGNRYDVQAAREAMREALTVDVLRGSTVISVGFSGSQDKELPRILDIVIDQYLRAYKQDTVNRDLNLRTMMDGEVRRAAEERQILQGRLDDFRKQHDITRLTTANSDADIAYKKLSEDYAEMENYKSALQMQFDSFVRDLQTQGVNERPEQTAGVDDDERVKPLKTQYEQLLLAKDSLLQKLGPNHRTVKDVELQLSTVNTQLAKKREEVRRERDQIMLSGMQKQMMDVTVQMESMRPRLDEARTKLRELDMLLTEYDDLDRQLKVVQARQEKADELLKDMRIRVDRPDSAMITPLQLATVAELTFPNYPAMIVGVTMLLLALTAGAVFLKEVLDQRIKSPSDLALLPDATLLGVLPVTTDDPSGPAALEGIVQKDPAGLMAEAFRQVRTEVIGRMDRRGYKTLMLVGAQPGCGTSVVASNLATSIALSGRRVLLIDANLRRPGQCRLFNIKTSPGLAEVLKGQAAFEQAVTRNGDPKLDLIPAGEGGSTAPEIFDSPAMRNYLAQMEGQYDIVLIDAPPVLVASDARLLCKQVDAIALVVRAKAEKRGMIGRVLRELEGQRADILGIILNGVHISAGGYFRKNYQAFYRYRQNGQNNNGQTATAAAGRALPVEPAEKA